MSGLSLIRALDGSDMTETARILDISPEEVSSRDSEDRVALHYASETADASTFKRILELDPSLIDCQDQNGYTPLLVAAMSGNTSAIKILLERGAQINHIDKDKHSAIHWAVVCGQLDALVLLLQRGANVNALDNQEAQALHYATITEDIPHERSEAILHVLLKNGASVNGKDIDGRTAILWAASNGNTDAMLSLIQAGGDRYAVDRDRLSALHCAASHGHEHVLELLIESSDRSVIDAVDRNGDTPLFYAVTLGHFECARLLLLSGANANHQDFRLRTAAHCAAAKGQLRMLKILKHFGASFEIQNRRGDIPLHEAIQAASKDIVEWLLALHPSTVNSANHEGRTGLHLAAASGNMEIVVMLCSKNANVNPLMLYKGALYTPLDLAMKKEHELVVEYLTRRHLAKTADQIPEESRKDWIARLEEQVDQARKQGNYRHNYVEEFDRRFGSTRKISRQRSQSEIHTQETQTAQPDCKPAATNTSRNASRRPSSASPRTIISSLIPKATSTTDLLSLPGGTAMDDAQVDREAVDQRIQRIVHEEIQKAALAINEESRGKSAEEAETSITQSTTEAESIIVYPIEKNPETTKKKKKSIRMSSTKSKSSSRRRGDNEAKENVSPTMNSKKSKKKIQMPEVSDEEAELQASVTRHSDDNEDNLALTIPSDDQPNRSFEVVYSSAEDSAEDSLVFEEFRKKARRALRDTSDAAQCRDVFEGSVGKASTNQPRGKKANQRYLHEKAIFEELTHLKKMQIQYGKANERVLVRSLIGNFCKMHELNPAHFKFQTFYAWEKFLYDQLKLIYMEERQRLKNTRPLPNTRFESRLRQARAVPINMRCGDFARMSDEQSSSTKSTRKSASSTTTQKHSFGGNRRCECLGNHVLIK